MNLGGHPLLNPATQVGRPQSQPRELPVRVYLAGLIAAALLPLVGFSTWTVWRAAAAERATAEARLHQDSLQLASGVERELQKHLAALNALAVSKPLADDNLEDFQKQASEAIRFPGVWVALIDRQGRQLINTLRPYGQTAGAVACPYVSEIFRTGEPRVSDLCHGSISRTRILAVGVPITIGGEVHYVLSTGMLPSALQQVIIDQHLPESWRASIMDATGTIVARSHDPERWIGQPASAAVRKVTASGGRGLVPSKTLEGISSYVAAELVAGSGWTVAVAAPVDVVDGPLHRSADLVAATGALLLLLGLLGAYMVARRLARGSIDLEAAAAGLAKGDGIPKGTSTGIAEVERVRDSLTQAARLLHARELERDRALATQQQLADTLALAPVMVRGLDGTIRLWGGGVRDLYGFAEEEAAGRRSHDLLRTVFPEPLEVINATLLDDGYWRGELRHRRKDGGEVVVASQWTLSRDMEGQVRAVIEVNNDVTAAQQAQQERLRLAAIVESSDDAIISKDLTGTITSWNLGAERMLGYAAAEMVGRKIDVLVPPGLKDDVAYILERIRRGELVDHYETRRRRKDGTILDVALTVSPIRDASGVIVGASKIARDITERKQAETALRESEERFRALLENSPRMMWVNHADGSVEYFNAAWRDYTGHDTTMPGLAWMETIHEADRPAALEQREQAVAADKPYNFEVRLCRMDGAYRWHLATVAPLRRGGEIIAWVGTATDVHDMRTAKEVLERRVAERTARLSEANAELEAFAYSVAHDLRAPLRSMQGFSNALLEDYGNELDAGATDYATRIARGAAHMDDLINDLLAYSRLTREELRLEPLSLSAAVDEALRRVQAAVEERRAEVQVDSMLPQVHGNRTVLVQVLANLIGNAVKFTAPDVAPQVTIQAEDRGAVVRIWVEDNGIGIAEKHREKIFQVFQRLHSQKAYPGTGIGLAIVRKGIERMGGQVGVESELGSGSRFWFDLAKKEE